MQAAMVSYFYVDIAMWLPLIYSTYIITDILNIFYNFFHDAAAPSGAGPPHCRVFTITLRHTSSGGVISLTQRPLLDNTQYSQEKDINALKAFKPKVPAS